MTISYFLFVDQSVKNEEEGGKENKEEKGRK
jgi:hypothetical protein